MGQGLEASGDRGAAAGGQEQQEPWWSTGTSQGPSWPRWCSPLRLQSPIVAEAWGEQLFSPGTTLN